MNKQNMRKFNIGDRVITRDFLSSDYSHFIPLMSKYIGKEGTIDAISNKDEYLVHGIVWPDYAIDLYRLPDRWCINLKNASDEIVNYVNENGARKGKYEREEYNDKYAHFPKINPNKTTSREIHNGYTEITHDEFFKFILNIKEMKTYTFTREMAKRIYNVACSPWKQTILEKVKESISPLSDSGEISETFVKEMFDAASKEQKETLRELFPDYKSDKNAFVSNFEENEIYDMSNKLFGSRTVLQILGPCCPSDREDLRGRAFYVDNKHIVNIGEAIGGTYIEIKNK